MPLEKSHSALFTTLVLAPQVLVTIAVYRRSRHRGPGGELGGAWWRS